MPKSYGTIKEDISLIVQQILTFASSPNNLSPIFNKIAQRCFILLNILIGIVRSMLSVNSK